MPKRHISVHQIHLLTIHAIKKVTVLRKLFKVDRFFLLPELQVITVFILSKEFTYPSTAEETPP